MKFVAILILALCGLLVMSGLAPLPNSLGSSVDQDTLNLTYDLTVGDVYVFRLITDQHVGAKSAVRMQNLLSLEIVDSDRLGNLQVNVRIRSDSTIDISDTLAYRKKGGFLFGGNRLFSESGRFEAVADALGRLIAGQKISFDQQDQGVTSMTSRITDAVDSRLALQNNGMSFSLPMIAPDSRIILGEETLDTLYLASAIQPLASSIGPTGKPNSVPIHLDTMYRTTQLDSVVVENDIEVGYFFSSSRKHTKSGRRYTISTQMRRNMSTGIVLSIDERCYREHNGSTTLEYYSRSNLLHFSRKRPKSLDTLRK